MNASLQPLTTSDAPIPRAAGPARRGVSIAICGSGGAGAMTTATLLVEAAGAAGWYGYMTRSSGAQIRGGEAAAMVRLSAHPVDSHDDAFDLLVAIDWDNVGRFAAEIPLDASSLLVGDDEAGEPPASILAMQPRRAPARMAAAAEAIEGGRPNMIALGIIVGAIGLPAHPVHDAIARSLAAKGAGAIEASKRAVDEGIALAAGMPPVPKLPAARADGLERWSVTGNELAGLGAIRGGVRFVAAYPITPGTEILEWLAPNLAKVGGVLVQAEDELASINQIVGASYAGVPSLTATAGPGLALMTESIGLAVCAEIPIVVVDVMRGGPSTGIPVKSEQSDLHIACYGLHGDAPHLVVAPLSVADCLFATQWAVHMAEALQSPAIVLSDQSQGQARAVIPHPGEVAFIARRKVARPAGAAGPYRRYAPTASGVSPMALPGTPGGQYTASGLEHNESAAPSSLAADHLAQLDKRSRKLECFDYGDHWASIEGDDGAENVIVTWGSSTGPAREALERLQVLGVRAKLVALRLLSPAQPARFAAAIAGARRVLVVEQSHGRQFLKLLRAHYDFATPPRSLAQPGPLPLRPGDIVRQFTDWS